MSEIQKTIFKYDVRGGGFKKASLFLLLIATILAIFGFFWLKSWL